MKRIWTLALAAAALAVAAMPAAVAADDDWIAVSAGHDEFHFRMPAAPQSEVSNDTEDGVPFTQTFYSVAVEGFFAMASVLDYHTDKATVDLQVYVTSFVQGFEGELLSNTVMPYSRGPGDELTGALVSVKKDTLDCKLRVVLDKNKAYMLGGCVPHGGDEAPLQRLLSSFSLTR